MRDLPNWKMVMKSTSQAVKNYWRVSRLYAFFLTQKVHPTKIPGNFLFTLDCHYRNWCVQCVFIHVQCSKNCPFPSSKIPPENARHGFGLHVAALINPTRSAAAPPHEEVEPTADGSLAKGRWRFSTC